MAPYDVYLAPHTCPSRHAHGAYHVVVAEALALGGHDGNDDDVLDRKSVV